MRRYGLIGRPLGHSASAAYFAAKFEREGIADCAYALYELPDIGALEGLLARTPDLCGHGAYGVYGRHIFVADHRPDTCAVEHRFGDLGFGDGVVFR